MRILAGIFLLLLPMLSYAQPNNKNYIDGTVTITPNFTLNTTTLLESSQTIANSFYLSVRTERRNALIYASIPAGITTSTSTPMSVGNVKIKYNHTTCPAAQQVSITTGEIVMTTSDQLLFNQDQKGGVIAQWYYDVIIPALGYNYAPGDYNFTFLFTMTQP